MRLRLVLLVLVALAAGLQTAQAEGYSNGQLPRSALAPVHSFGGLKVYSAKPAAASWNVAANCAIRNGVDLGVAGSRSAYRSYSEQVYFWNLYRSGRGNLAAYPGTSNHGWGRAWDLGTYGVRDWIRSHQSTHSIRKIEAFSEWWHYNFTGGRTPPDPGPSTTFPHLRIGSGGPCLSPAVREVQTRLKVRPVSGYFGPATAAAVRAFEKRSGWTTPDGIVTYATWAALRKTSASRVGQAYLHPASPPMVGQDVRALQGKLNARFKEMGYKTRVTVDGVFGPATGSAVKLFQRARGIKPISGVVGPATQKALATPVVAAAPTLPAPNPKTPDPPQAAPLEPRVVMVNWSKHQGERWSAVGAIAIHTTEGWDVLSPQLAGLTAACNYFASNTREVSVHISIDRYGQSCRSVPDTRRAYHAGRHNTYTLGIEQLGFQAYTRADWLKRTKQLDATAAWIAYWTTKYRIPLSRCVTDAQGDLKVHGVCAHQQLDPVNRRDPGAGYPWDYVLARAASLAGASQ